MTATLTVAAVKQGTVIDHIPENVALVILRFLHRSDEKHTLTIGLHLRSKKLGKKDVIKIHNRSLSKEESACIAVFAPSCTVNLIEDYEVVEKFRVGRPEKIIGIFSCPNPACITKKEKATPTFFVDPYRKELHLTCSYCNRSFAKDSICEYRN